MNYTYKGEENPVERLRNKLSSVFTVIELIERAKCSGDIGDMIKRSGNEAVKVLPDIILHLEDIEEFYKNKYKNK